MTSNLEELKLQRTTTKKSITRIKNIIEKSGKGENRALSAVELKCRLEIVEAYFKQLLSIQTSIEKLDAEDACRFDLEEVFIATKVVIQERIHEQAGEDAHNITFSDTVASISTGSSKLPQLKLPTFSGKYSEYKNFIVSFTQMVDREPCLSNIDKFNHLRNCLQGAALDTVQAFQITKENYPKALKRLSERYDNPTLIFLENITSLFDLPSISKPQAAGLRSLVDNASAIYGSLLSLGTPKQVSEVMLIYLVLQKADEETRNKWKQSLDYTELPLWENCRKVLERHCQYLESLDSAGFADPRTNDKGGKKQPPKPQQTGYSYSCSKTSCLMCSETSHKISNCERFKSLDISKRFENVKRLALCINCLSKGHKLSNCPSSNRCKTCSQQHHSLLHRSKPSTVENSDGPQATKPTTNQGGAVVHTHVGSMPSESIILATAMVLVRDASGCYKVGRALLDSCSQVNFMTDEFSQKLKLPRNKHNIAIHSVGNSLTNVKYQSSTTIKSQVNEFELPLNFCITSTIAYQPEEEIDISCWKLPANAKLADEQFNKSKRIDLLLGTESFFSILSVGQIRLGDDLPILQKTLFGWIVSGRYRTQYKTKNSVCHFSCDAIEANLERLWKLDEIMIPASPWTQDQHRCEQLYKGSVSRNCEGRVVARLPFKDDPRCLGQSYAIALQRFMALERRLSRSPDLKGQYVKFMSEYKDLGHMSLVTKPNVREPHYYIPHHSVLKPSSTSTKLRVVFDASCCTTSQKSLNNIQFVGPTLQDELFILLLRFRLYRYAISADIVKMYRQVLIDPKDRKFQYILWRPSPEYEISTYELNTVTYGMAAAPYLAVRSLHFVADQHSDEFELGARIVKSSFYVDDLLCGADSTLELNRIKAETTALLRRGGFELAKWHSNHPDIRDDNSSKSLNIDESSVTSALGLKWDQESDSFLFSFEPKRNPTSQVTKRSILSTSSALFDPLGPLSPIIIKAKIILQELWLLKLNWDESVPQDINLAWGEFLQQLSSLSSIKIPRFTLSQQFESVQIHGFSDASIRAYGCSLYTRSTDKDGRVCVRLFAAKSRVAPTRKQSLPKLELCGALLLTRLFNKVKTLFEHLNYTLYLWTDSQIVLHWLKTHSATLSTFVGNRVSEIQELSSSAHWRHVPSQYNPADIVSRGCTVEELLHSIWLTGPGFLSHKISEWPLMKCEDIDLEEVNKEKRKSAFKSTVTTNYILTAIDKFSSHIVALRVIAWMFRFHKRLTKPIHFQTMCLFPQELQHALFCIVWNVQQHYFSEEISLLKAKTAIKGPLKFLNPFLKYTGGFTLLKVGGRL